MELIDLRRGADGEGVPLRFAGCVIVLAMRMFFLCAWLCGRSAQVNSFLNSSQYFANNANSLITIGFKIHFYIRIDQPQNDIVICFEIKSSHRALYTKAPMRYIYIYTGCFQLSRTAQQDSLSVPCLVRPSVTTNNQSLHNITE